MTPKEAHYIKTIEKRVKDLEELYRNFTDDHEGRITTLENRLNIHVRSDIGETGDRIKALEDWQKNDVKDFGIIEDRIKALEKWKESVQRGTIVDYTRNDDCNLHSIVLNGKEMMVIGKTVWEDLKRHVKNARKHDLIPFTYKDAFENIIRRVEPDWDPE